MRSNSSKHKPRRKWYVKTTLCVCVHVCSLKHYPQQPRWKQTESPSMNDWLKKIRCICVTKYYTSLTNKKNCDWGDDSVVKVLGTRA